MILLNEIKKIKYLLIKPIISLVWFIVCVFISAGLTLYIANHIPYSPRSSLKTSYRIGQEAHEENFSFAVKNVSRDSVGAGPLTPPEGYEFVITKIVLKNNSNSSFEFIPFLFLHVKDLEGNVYTPTAVPTGVNQFSGPILSGDVLQEDVGFAVPKNTKGLTLYLETGSKAGNQIIAIDIENHLSWWFWK